LDANVIVSPTYVKLSEKGAASQMVNGLGNEWGNVSVLLGPMVDQTVVLYWAKLTVLLLDEEEVCGIGAP